jgi:hypothetical protein
MFHHNRRMRNLRLTPVMRDLASLFTLDLKFTFIASQQKAFLLVSAFLSLIYVRMLKLVQGPALHGHKQLSQWESGQH